MEFLGIGPLELFFIIVIALIVLGPKDMVKTGRTIGKFLRNVVTSPNWHTIQQASRDIRQLPNKLIREAGLEDIKKELPDPTLLSQEAGLDQLSKEIRDFQTNMSDWSKPTTKLSDTKNEEQDRLTNPAKNNKPDSEILG